MNVVRFLRLEIFVMLKIFMIFVYSVFFLFVLLIGIMGRIVFCLFGLIVDWFSFVVFLDKWVKIL